MRMDDSEDEEEVVVISPRKKRFSQIEDSDEEFEESENAPKSAENETISELTKLNFDSDDDEGEERTIIKRSDRLEESEPEDDPLPPIGIDTFRCFDIISKVNKAYKLKKMHIPSEESRDDNSEDFAPADLSRLLQGFYRDRNFLIASEMKIETQNGVKIGRFDVTDHTSVAKFELHDVDALEDGDLEKFIKGNGFTASIRVHKYPRFGSKYAGGGKIIQARPQRDPAPMHFIDIHELAEIDDENSGDDFMIQDEIVKETDREKTVRADLEKHGKTDDWYYMATIFLDHTVQTPKNYNFFPVNVWIEIIDFTAKRPRHFFNLGAYEDGRELLSTCWDVHHKGILTKSITRPTDVALVLGDSDLLEAFLNERKLDTDVRCLKDLFDDALQCLNMRQWGKSQYREKLKKWIPLYENRNEEIVAHACQGSLEILPDMHHAMNTRTHVYRAALHNFLERNPYIYQEEKRLDEDGNVKKIKRLALTRMASKYLKNKETNGTEEFMKATADVLCGVCQKYPTRIFCKIQMKGGDLLADEVYDPTADQGDSHDDDDSDDFLEKEENDKSSEVEEISNEGDEGNLDEQECSNDQILCCHKCYLKIHKGVQLMNFVREVLSFPYPDHLGHIRESTEFLEKIASLMDLLKNSARTLLNKNGRKEDWEKDLDF